jgi:hypothetical protein
MTVYTCTLGDLTQRLAVLDLDGGGVGMAIRLMPESVELVYSDPPWNPGNATYWRTHAKQSACESYARFLDRLVEIYVQCQNRGARNVLIEQSIRPEHHGMFLTAVDRNPAWKLAYQGHYEVFYSRQRRPNALLHFGSTKLATDPSGLSGEPMTLRAITGTRPTAGAWIVDPCMGLGMTSRMAHGFGLNCLGTELNPLRLAKTVSWLTKQGYSVEES